MAADGTVKIVIEADGQEAISSVSDLEDHIKGLGNTGNKAGGMLGSLKDKISFGAVAGLASKGIQTLTGGIGNLISEAANASDAMDKFKSTMQFAGFSGKEIKAASKDMKTYADQTVYELGDVMNTTAQLAANGIGNYRTLTKAAGNLNAVAGGNASTFKSVAMVLTQTAGAGKLTTENWNQLTDAIPGASGKLQEAMKKNGAYTGNFRDAMEKGQISAGEFNKAIEQLGMTKAAKEAAKSTETFEGAIGNLQAGAVNAFMSIYNAIGKENITGFINGLTGMIDKAAPAISSGIQFISSVIGLLVNYISGDFSSFDKFHKRLVNLVGADAAGKIMPIIAQIGGAIGDFVSIVKASLGVLTGGTKSYKQFSEAINLTVPKGVVDTMWGIAKGIKAVVDAAASHPKAVSVLVGSLVALAAASKGLNVISSVGSKISSTFSVLGSVGSKVKNLIPGLSGVGKAAKATGTQMGSSAKDMASMGLATLEVGAGIGAAAAGFGLLAFGIASIAKQGTSGLVALVAMTGSIIALGVAFKLLGPSLTANAVGIGVFGASVLAMGIGIGAAAVGIATLIAAFTALTANVSAIIPTFAAVGIGFNLMMTTILTGIITNGPLITQAMITIGTSILTTINALMPQIATTIATGLLTILTTIGAYAPQYVAIILQTLVNILNTLATYIGPIAGAVTNILVAIMQAIGENAPRIVAAFFAMIGQFAAAIVEQMPYIITIFGALIAGLIAAGIAYASAFFKLGGVLMKGLWAGITGKKFDIGSATADVMKGAADDASKAGASAFDSMGGNSAIKALEGLSKKKGDAKNAGSDLMSSARAGMDSKKPEAKSAGSGVGGSAVFGLDSKKGEANSAGANMGAGFNNGLESQRGNINATAQSIANQASGTLKAALKEHSPSKLTFGYGDYFGQGFVNGMLNQIRSVNETAEAIASTATSGITGGLVSPSAASLSSSGFRAVPNNQTINNYTTNNHMTAEDSETIGLLRQIADKSPIIDGSSVARGLAPFSSNQQVIRTVMTERGAAVDTSL